MTKCILFFVFSLVITTFLDAQNLVPNPSFEGMRHLPVKTHGQNNFEYERGSGFRAFKGHLNYWLSGNKATPDLRLLSPKYFSICQTKYPNCDKAKSGVNALGIITFMDKPDTGEYREYLQVKLKTPLRKGIKTYVEFWVVKERKAKLAANNMGCYFSVKRIYAPHTGVINVQPQVNYAEIINKNSFEWTKIAWTFMPEEAHSFVTIGNFFHNDRTQSKEVVDYFHFKGYIPSAYYLIDDVRIWQEGDTIEDIPLVFEDIEIKINTPIRLENIEFPSNSAVLYKASYEELNKLVAFLNTKKMLSIAIHGHTDNVGNTAANLTLSAARAKSVYDFLVEKGIAKNRLFYEGFGEQKPIVNNDTATGRERNRRVEFVIIK